MLPHFKYHCNPPIALFIHTSELISTLLLLRYFVVSVVSLSTSCTTTSYFTWSWGMRPQLSLSLLLHCSCAVNTIVWLSCSHMNSSAPSTWAAVVCMSVVALCNTGWCSVPMLVCTLFLSCIIGCSSITWFLWRLTTSPGQVLWHCKNTEYCHMKSMMGSGVLHWCSLHICNKRQPLQHKHNRPKLRHPPRLFTQPKPNPVL